MKTKARQDEIYRALRTSIERGEFPAHARLPSVRILARRFSASANTVSKAFSRLMESGLCTAQRGVGVFVSSPGLRRVGVLAAEDDGAAACERALRAHCQQDGLAVLRAPLERGRADDRLIARIDEQCQGVIAVGQLHEELLERLMAMRRPLVVVGSTPLRARVSSVAGNPFRSGYLAGRHLMRAGLRRIAVVGRRDGDGRLSADSVAERAGVRCACLEDAWTIDPALSFADIADLAERLPTLSAPPDAAVLPASVADAAADLLGRGVERIVIGDDQLLERARRPTVIAWRRAELAELAIAELRRLAADPAAMPRRLLAAGELHESVH